MPWDQIPGGWVTAVCAAAATIVGSIVALRKHWDGVMLSAWTTEMQGLRTEMATMRVENADLRKEVRQVRAELDQAQNVAAEQARQLLLAEIENRRLRDQYTSALEEMALGKAHIVTLEADVARERLLREAAEARVKIGP